MSEKVPKKPVSVTLDPEILHAVQDLVASGQTSSVSAWLNETARYRIERDRQAARVRAYVEENLLGGARLSDEELTEAEGMVAASIARTEARRSAGGAGAA